MNNTMSNQEQNPDSGTAYYLRTINQEQFGEMWADERQQELEAETTYYPRPSDDIQFTIAKSEFPSIQAIPPAEIGGMISIGLLIGFLVFWVIILCWSDRQANRRWR